MLSQADIEHAENFARQLHDKCDPPKGGMRVGQVSMSVAVGSELAVLLDRMIAQAKLGSGGGR